ncbi:MAG: hypothetical protein E6G14_08610 [Actinobacteria bacterium]|nr:MAG: hypothetical protein E6G14_08610 [Actinomycetota bacterium]
MDRAAHARAALRRQAEDALAFEREREAMLTVELQDMVAEVHGPEIAGEVFAAMTPEDALLVRAALGGGERVDDEDDEDDVDDEESGEDPEDADAAGEEEIARLQAEIESSCRSQAALERYLELLDR